MRTITKIIVFLVCICIAGLARVYATQYGQCGDNYYVDYQRTYLMEARGTGENGVNEWIAKADMVKRNNLGMEIDRTVIYVTLDDEGNWKISKLIPGQWRSIPDGQKYMVIFCQKVEDYIFQ